MSHADRAGQGRTPVDHCGGEEDAPRVPARHPVWLGEFQSFMAQLGDESVASLLEAVHFEVRRRGLTPIAPAESAAQLRARARARAGDPAWARLETLVDRCLRPGAGR